MAPPTTRQMLKWTREVYEEVCSEKQIKLIDSFNDQMERGYGLSKRQVEVLRDSYRQVCESSY